MSFNDFLINYKKILNRSKDNSSIDYENAIDLYNKGKAIIVDVRNEDEYEEYHLKGALNIPVYEMENNISKFGNHKELIIIVYCATGKRSKIARKILIKKGYKNVFILYIK